MSSYNRKLNEKVNEILSAKMSEEEFKEAWKTITFSGKRHGRNEIMVSPELIDAKVRAAVEMYAPEDAELGRLESPDFKISEFGSLYFEVRRSFHVSSTVYVEFSQKWGEELEYQGEKVSVTSLVCNVTIKTGSSSTLDLQEAQASIELAQEMMAFANKLKLALCEYPVFVEARSLETNENLEI